MRILHVEDDARDVDLVRRVFGLRDPEAVIEVARTVSAARDRLSGGLAAVDLVLLDLCLPDGSGWDLLVEITGGQEPPPVVVLTGQGQDDLAVAAMRLGAADFVVKGDDLFDRLVSVVHAACDRAREAPPPRPEPLRVLYVEHEPADVDLTRRHLARRARHIHLEVAATAEEALAGLPATPTEKAAWDVLLVDYRLPGRDALELMQIVRERGLDLPVVIVTGQGSVEVAVRALRLGATHYVVKHDSYLHELPGVLESARDRARLLREQAAFRESEARLSAIVESTMDCIIAVGEDQRILLFNPAAEALFGWRKEEALGQPLDRLLPATQRGAHREHIRAFGQSGKTRRPMGRPGPVTGLRADGTEIPLEASISRGHAPAGPLYTAILRDVSERVARERELRETQERLQAAVAAGNVGLWDWDIVGGGVRYSREWKRQIGWAEDEVSDSFDEWESRVHPDDLPPTTQKLQEYLAAGSGPYSTEFRFRHRDGSYRHILAEGSVVRGKSGEPLRMLGSHIDITERVALEAKFLQAQKMESVGRLASGVAHDFNNLLTIILTSAELALGDLDPEGAAGSVARDLETIVQTTRRASALTHQLLAFSREQVLQPIVQRLDVTVAGVEDMLRRLLGADVELRIVRDAAGGFVRADARQLEMAVMNLAVNARDAMPRGGQLTIETRCVDVQGAPGATAPERPAPGAYVLLAVSDTGEGMTEATRARVFEPFFTTKALGKGTGLGLSTVHEIVEQNGGVLRVESQLGRGTRFEIYLPRVPQPAEQPASSRRPSAVPGGDATVLVVDDLAGVRNASARILRQAGYDVIVAASGPEALSLAASRRGAIDLLVTDLVMPEMSGVELAKRLRAERPSLRVLYTSGFSGASAQAVGTTEASAFLAKPFSGAELASKVRAVLAEADASSS